MASVCVIAIHVLSSAKIDNLYVFFFVQGIARLAVPFFFCCTGYFIAQKGIENRTVVIDYIKKLCKSYLIGSLVYIPVELIKMIATNTFSKAAVLKYLQYILVQGSFLHLWYFPAVIVAIVCLHFLLKRLSIRMTCLVAACLYFIGLLGDGYYGVFRFLPQWASDTMKIYQELFYTTRNGLFFGVPFVLIGVAIAKRTRLQTMKKAYVWLVATLVAGCGEIYFLRRFQIAVDYNMTVFLVPATVFLFLTLLKMPYKIKFNSNLLRLYSTKLYEAHLLFYGLLLAALTVFQIPILKNGAVQFFVVWAASQMFAYFTARAVANRVIK
ncbi:serine/alanine racemase [Hydrogenoanaerobacterium saccharovorans]|uniref:Serine/alanine racemase n=1 Tax=Hydrogenoanaerobacterium saccharovorans TaxID=474960 RepID=A0A1H8E2A6_9FIRM|nr:serine/alanine racemase [Hydrogenoanaerobacterium saccharovorans]